MEKKTGFIIVLLTYFMVACSHQQHSHGVPVDVEYVIDRYEMTTKWYEASADYKDHLIRTEASGVIDSIIGSGDILESNAVVSTIVIQTEDTSKTHVYEQIHHMSESKVVNLYKKKGDIVKLGDPLFSVVPTNHIHLRLVCSETDARWMEQVKTIMVTNVNRDSYHVGSMNGYHERSDESDQVEVDILITKTNTIFEQGQLLECAVKDVLKSPTHQISKETVVYQDDATYVFVIGHGGYVSKQPVVVVSYDTKYAYVKDIKQGLCLVGYPPIGMKDGDHVTIKNELPRM
ncbi:hypothetical protein N9N03_00315 [Chlamydiia bacterium]|nr:hypothetical protein [Chlamydiia bacterium]